MKQPSLFGNAVVTTPAIADAFERFWSIYPERAGGDPKKPAKVLFDRKVQKDKVDPEAIIRGVAAFAEFVKANRTEPKFIPMAQTWLGQERWECKYDVASVRQKSYMQISEELFDRANSHG